MKRIIIILLTFVLLLNTFPINIYATEEEFVNIIVELNGNTRYCKVIEKDSELMFSGEDLAEFGGFEYHIENGNAYFTRGSKILQVDINKNKFYPYEKLFNMNFKENICNVDGVFYYPGSEMLPWLNVACDENDGTLCIFTDTISIWEVIPEFNPNEFSFDLIKCCKELGVNNKYLKASAYIAGKGIGGVFWDVVPVFGTSVEYMELFENIILDKSSVGFTVEEILEDGEKVDYWMDKLEQIDPDIVYSDQVALIRSFVSALTTLSGSIELAMYFVAICEHNEDVLNALISMQANGSYYGLPEEAIDAIDSIRRDYENFSNAVERKVVLLGTDFFLDKLKDKAPIYFRIALEVIELAEITSPDWADGVNFIDKYMTIANYCLDGYENEKNVAWMSSIRDTRGFAFMYLYACEQNWRTMADYASDKERTDLEKKYLSIADSAEEWQGKFLSTAISEMNDSHEYGEGEYPTKLEYTKILKDIFLNLELKDDINGEYVVSFSSSDLFESGDSLYLTFTYYECVTHRKSDIFNLKPGDILHYFGKDIVVEDIVIETWDYDGQEMCSVMINDTGSVDEAVELISDINDPDQLIEVDFYGNDYPRYQSVQTITMKVAEDVCFYDESENLGPLMEPKQILYYELMEYFAESFPGCYPHSTTITIDNNEIISINRVWVP